MASRSWPKVPRACPCARWCGWRWTGAAQALACEWRLAISRSGGTSTSHQRLTTSHGERSSALAWQARHDLAETLQAARQHGAVAAAGARPGAWEEQIPNQRHMRQAPRVGIVQGLVPAVDCAAIVAGVSHIGQRRSDLFDLDRLGKPDERRVGKECRSRW